jgi:hypothetical protein
MASSSRRRIHKRTQIVYVMMDLGPLSIICGDLNRRHQNEVLDLVVEVVVNHVLDRIHHGWLDRHINDPVMHCIRRGLLTREAMDRAKQQLLRNPVLSIDRITVYLSVIDDKVTTVASDHS